MRSTDRRFAFRSFLLKGLNAIIGRDQVRLPVDPDRIQHILIMRYDAIGDLIVTMPMIELLHTYAPTARISVVTSPRNDFLLRHRPDVERFCFDGTLRSALNIRAALGPDRPDLIFSLVLARTTKAGVLARMWGAPKAVVATIAHESRVEEYRTWFSAQVAMPRNVETMCEMQMRLAATVAGCPLPVGHVPYRLATGAAPSAARGSDIGLNLSAGNPFRTLGAQQNERLVRGLLAAFPDRQLRLFSAPEDAARADELMRIAPQRITRAQGASFLEVIERMREISIMVTPDTSVVHAAAAMGTPVVVMFSTLASHQHEWMPYGVPYRCVVTTGREPLDTLNMDDVVQRTVELVASQS